VEIGFDVMLHPSSSVSHFYSFIEYRCPHQSGYIKHHSTLLYIHDHLINAIRSQNNYPVFVFSTSLQLLISLITTAHSAVISVRNSGLCFINQSINHLFAWM